MIDQQPDINVPMGFSASDFAVRLGADKSPVQAVLLDGDDSSREKTATDLDGLGFDVASFSSFEPMLDYLAINATAEVIVVSWELLDDQGSELPRLLHERIFGLPVVFTSDMPTIASEQVALDMGAADFVDKARGAAILAKRLRLIVRSNRAAPRPAGFLHRSMPLVFGPARIDTDQARAYWNEQDGGFTRTEFRVVSHLVSHAGQYVTCRSIYDCVQSVGFFAGSGDDGFRTNVRSSIKRIRKKFRQIDESFGEIETYAAFGYRWRRRGCNA